MAKTIGINFKSDKIFGCPKQKERGRSKDLTYVKFNSVECKNIFRSHIVMEAIAISCKYTLFVTLSAIKDEFKFCRNTYQAKTSLETGVQIEVNDKEKNLHTYTYLYGNRTES